MALPRLCGWLRCETHAKIYIVLTALELIFAILAFIFCDAYARNLDRLGENLEGNIKSEDLPCIRRTYNDVCPNGVTDVCKTSCCPESYFCTRSPIAGVYCQDKTIPCNDHNFCRDYADPQGNCDSDACQARKLIFKIKQWTYVLAVAGIILDLLDIITCCVSWDSVLCKSVMNMAGAGIKLMSFGLLLGAGTHGLLSDLKEKQCYNVAGMDTLEQADAFCVLFLVFQFFSFLLSLALTPLSAYYGGHLQGTAEVKWKTMPQ